MTSKTLEQYSAARTDQSDAASAAAPTARAPITLEVALGSDPFPTPPRVGARIARSTYALTRMYVESGADLTAISSTSPD
ncbi:hypothetical protein [Nocardia sp. NPDC051463]|uniref:hypothetical protein n=1 Tax=Nocardia sp. NPDC051463 TaxID=3154845 RepID=UPI00344C95CE